MSQDNGEKKEASQTTQEEAITWIKQRIENDWKGIETNPPPPAGHRSEDFQPPNKKYQLERRLRHSRDYYRRHPYCIRSDLFCTK
jgi:hypothetical protein